MKCINVQTDCQHNQHLLFVPRESVRCCARNYCIPDVRSVHDVKRTHFFWQLTSCTRTSPTVSLSSGLIFYNAREPLDFSWLLLDFAVKVKAECQKTRSLKVFMGPAEKHNIFLQMPI